MRTCFAVSLLPALSSAVAAGLDLDPGGTSFGYPMRKAVEPVGENAIENGSFERKAPGRRPPGWFCGFHVYAGKLDKLRGTTIHERVARQVTMMRRRGDAYHGDHFVRLHIPGAAWRKGDLNFSARVQRDVDLPEPYGRVAVQFAYRMTAGPPAPGRGHIMVHFLDEDNQPTEHWKQWKLQPTGEWTLRSLPLRLAKGTSRLRLTLYLDGAGVADYDAVAVYPLAEEEEPVSVRCVPMSFLDGVYALSSNDPSLIQFGVKSQLDANKIHDPRLWLELPREVRILDAADVMRSMEIREKGRRYQAGFRLASLKGMSGEHHSDRGGYVLLITTAAKPGAELGELSFWMEYALEKGAERITTARASLKLEVLPSIHAPAPTIFEIGAMLRRQTRAVAKPKAVSAYADFVKRCGINLVPGGGTSAVGRACVDRGLRVFYEGGVVNAFMYGWRTLPKDVGFILADGSVMRRGICPTVIYRRLPFYQENIYEGIIHKQVAVEKTAHGFNVNWEPYMFFEKGCFCDKCKREFIENSGMPAEEVDKLWPLDLLKRHRQRWRKFFAWQHGMVAKTLDADARKAGAEVGVKGCYIPEVTPTVFLPENAADRHTVHTDPKQYAFELAEYASWGGYWSFDYLMPDMHPAPGSRLGLKAYVEAFRTWIETHAPKAERPKLHWLYHAYQGGRRVTFPEAITFDALACFVLGMDGAWAYVFPKGYDNRYWAALAAAARQTARWEPYVLGGERVDAVEAAALTPLPEVERGPLLHAAAFRRKGRLLAAVGNFWMNGECFFRLKIKGLPPGRYALLPDTPEAAPPPTWTASQLAGEGALMHVGAMRWVFFEARPADGPPGAAAARDAEMRGIMEERKPRILAAYEQDLRRLASLTPQTAEAGDVEVEAMKVGALAAAAEDVTGDGVPEIVFRRPGETLAVDVARGGRVVQWKMSGVDLAFSEGHGLAMDALWLPGYMTSDPVDVESLEKRGNAIVLTTEFKLPKKAKEAAGLLLRREVIVPVEKEPWRVSTTILNPTDEAKTFSFRYANMPRFLTLPEGGEGYAVLTAPGGDQIRYTRKFMKEAFRMADKDREADLDTYRMDAVHEIAGPDVTFGASWTKLEVKASVPAEDLYKIVFWDSGAQKCATAEWVFRKVKLGPGEEWGVTMHWRARP